VTLLDQAREDCRSFVGSDSDFGVDVLVTAPDQSSATLTGLVNDVGAAIDPETGLPVAVRVASVTLEFQATRAALGALPQGVHDAAAKPWTVAFDDAEGVTHTWKVVRTMPDRVMGVVVCQLELYDAG
jgi:hypothetical protein